MILAKFLPSISTLTHHLQWPSQKKLWNEQHDISLGDLKALCHSREQPRGGRPRGGSAMGLLAVCECGVPQERIQGHGVAGVGIRLAVATGGRRKLESAWLLSAGIVWSCCLVVYGGMCLRVDISMRHCLRSWVHYRRLRPRVVCCIRCGLYHWCCHVVWLLHVHHCKKKKHWFNGKYVSITTPLAHVWIGGIFCVLLGIFLRVSKIPEADAHRITLNPNRAGSCISSISVNRKQSWHR